MPKLDDINRENRRIWNANADFWDGRIGDGNEFQDLLIEPASLALLDIQAGERVLDAACGAGRFGRRLAGLGAYVVGFDFCDRFIEIARSKATTDRNEYHVIDATDLDAMLSLGTEAFDAAVCTMALMDIADIEPLMAAVAKLLKPRGRFVFTVLHPAFATSGTGRFVEEYWDSGRLSIRRGVKVMAYKTVTAHRAEGIVGQPEPHYYFDRPIEKLLEPAFTAGLTVDGFVEPAMSAAEPDRKRGLSWAQMPDLPPILAVRLRKVE